MEQEEEGEGDKERRGDERRGVPGGRVLDSVEHELRVVARGVVPQAEVGREHLVRHAHLARQPRQRERVRLLQRSAHSESSGEIKGQRAQASVW